MGLSYLACLTFKFFIDVTNWVWSLQEEFEEHAEKVKTLPENTTNENKLILYGLFKQATVGPVNTSE